ncbi:hypothetical protein FKW77_002104 [Venturia effusa]|uniref:ARCA protein n=1 Tax=Venturia effusa TaxID=50376 RepID=A0A517LDB0_9PEZI|nr:hypothetical protein FKW77_002104 [Venturia effusa]
MGSKHEQYARISRRVIFSVKSDIFKSVRTVEGFGQPCEYVFAEDQPWPRTKRLSFIDETKDIATIYDHDLLSAGLSIPPDRTPTLSVLSTRHDSTPRTLHGRSGSETPTLLYRPTDEVTSPTEPRILDLDHSSGADFQSDHHTPIPRSVDESITPNIRHAASQSPFTQRFDSDSLDIDFASASSSHGGLHMFDTPAVDAAPQIYIDNPQWPLRDLEQAKLMRHYIDSIAPFLDLCDLKRHFALVVPHRAASCPPLLNAIFAASARHLSRVAGAEAWIADNYHSECLKSLIPLLNNSAALKDENLLAAMIILRQYEEFESPNSGTGAQSHLLGTHIFMGAQERSAVSGGLRRAAFWVGLRMELFFAFLNSRSIHPSLELCNVDRSLEPADDCRWANRMVAHCAEALRYCFGDGEHSIGRYMDLVQYCSDWMAYKPPSFTPIYYREPGENDMFPEIWMNGQVAGTGMLHYRLTRILLTAHSPKIPRLGPGQRAALREADEEIKNDVRTICGIAQSNECPPYFVKACMAITLAGDKFTERREQEALLRVMQRGSELAWPTMTTALDLKKAWGWQQEQS